MNKLLLLAIAAAVGASAQPVPSQSRKSCEVGQYGAKGDGVAADTRAIQSAIDGCAAGGGGTVVLPAGRYLSGTIRLRSNITLWLEPGATLVGTRDLSQYQSAVEGQVWYDALLLGQSVSNVAVMGRGSIDGNKVRNPKGEERMRGPHAILFMDARDVTVRDISIQDAGNYNMIVRRSERLNIDGITIRGGWDGINMHDSRDVTIANCRIYTGDDSLAGANWENVTVSNCILNSSANTIRAGGRNVLFNNLVMYGPGEYPAGTSQRHKLEAGFQILPNRPPGAGEKRLVKPGPIDNMVVSNVTMINVGTPIFIAYSSDASYSANNLGVGNITFSNVTVRGAGMTPIYISAPRQNPAKSIVLNNVRVTGKGGATEAYARRHGFSPFSILQSSGVYARNVERLELHDVRFRFDEPDTRSAIFAENVAALELDRFDAPHVGANGPPLMQLVGPGSVTWDGKAVPAVRATTAKPEGDSVDVRAVVKNEGSAGLAEVSVPGPAGTLERRVYLSQSESATVSFLNLKAGVAKDGRQPVPAPWRTFANAESETGMMADGSLYVRAAGDYPLQQFGDQYATIYREKALGLQGTVVVKVDNPDLRTNWVGRAGIVVRNDLTKPESAKGYAILAASPAAGISFEWDGDGDGRLDGHTPFDFHTVWPCWLKVVRDGDKVTGYSSLDGTKWEKVGEAMLQGASEKLDAGVFCYRNSALFSEFGIK